MATTTRPATERARRNRIWASVGLVIVGLAGVVFFVVTMHAFVTKCDGIPKGECTSPQSGYPAMAAVFPPIALWLGMVVVPREAWLLRREGRRLVLRPRYARQRERHWVFAIVPQTRVVTRAWLVADLHGGGTIAIPVSEADAHRCAPDIAALVRGRLRPRAHVAIDFPSELMWPTGTVQRLPAYASDDPEPSNEPRWRPLERWQVIWRVLTILFCAAFALTFLVTEVDIGDGGASCGSVVRAIAMDGPDGCVGEGAAAGVGIAAFGLIAIGLTVQLARGRGDRSSDRARDLRSGSPFRGPRGRP
jgi:hypothetical protein